MEKLLEHNGTSGVFRHALVTLPAHCDGNLNTDTFLALAGFYMKPAHPIHLPGWKSWAQIAITLHNTWRAHCAWLKLLQMYHDHWPFEQQQHNFHLLKKWHDNSHLINNGCMCTWDWTPFSYQTRSAKEWKTLYKLWLFLDQYLVLFIFIINFCIFFIS